MIINGSNIKAMKTGKGNTESIKETDVLGKIYKTIKPVLITLWTRNMKMNQEDIIALEIIERKIQGRIYGGNKVDDLWKRKTNEELWGDGGVCYEDGGRISGYWVIKCLQAVKKDGDKWFVTEVLLERPWNVF